VLPQGPLTIPYVADGIPSSGGIPFASADRLH